MFISCHHNKSTNNGKSLFWGGWVIYNFKFAEKIRAGKGFRPNIVTTNFFQSAQEAAASQVDKEERQPKGYVTAHVTSKRSLASDHQL